MDPSTNDPQDSDLQDNDPQNNDSQNKDPPNTGPPHIDINPPLLNSANPWCTTLEQLQELYDCPHTGAVTTRTSLLQGFPHDSSVHQFIFFNPNGMSSTRANVDRVGTSATTGSLNTLGYSPLPLAEYLGYIQKISDKLGRTSAKPFIISVTGLVQDIVKCYRMIIMRQAHVCMPLAMEINLSCPNIPGKPPPAYSESSLLSYLTALKTAIGNWLVKPPENVDPKHIRIPIGIKTPPYTYHDQYASLINALLASQDVEPTNLPCPVSFITATNTLGSCLVFEHAKGEYPINVYSGTGTGGLAGAPLHPLALGNVATIRHLLLLHRGLAPIRIIGVGGVEDSAGYNRFRFVGATAVGVGTALGRKGVKVFEEIRKGKGFIGGWEEEEVGTEGGKTEKEGKESGQTVEGEEEDEEVKREAL